MKRIELRTSRKNEMVKLDHQVQKVVHELRTQEGVVTVFCPHTTAGITLNENADPDVQSDMIRRLDQLIPLDSKDKHLEGNSDAHLKTSLIGTSVQVPVVEGKLKLGRWQSIYFCEFDGPRHREVWIFKS